MIVEDIGADTLEPELVRNSNIVEAMVVLVPDSREPELVRNSDIAQEVQVEAVPEPSTFIFFGIGLFMLIWRRWAMRK